MKPFPKLDGIRAVAFDVFGTIAEIAEKRRPYSQLMEKIYAAGLVPSVADAGLIMSANVTFSDVPSLFQTSIPAEEFVLLERELASELATIKLYPEVLFTLENLKAAGYKIGLCSNLAVPYAEPIKRLLPYELDVYTWSFEVGAVKPNEKIYQNLCDSLNCEPNEVLMIGDTFEADYQGPRDFGLCSIHLSRVGKSSAEYTVQNLDEILRLLLP